MGERSERSGKEKETEGKGDMKRLMERIRIRKRKILQRFNFSFANLVTLFFISLCPAPEDYSRHEAA